MLNDLYYHNLFFYLRKHCFQQSYLLRLRAIRKHQLMPFSDKIILKNKPALNCLTPQFRSKRLQRLALASVQHKVREHHLLTRRSHAFFR